MPRSLITSVYATLHLFTQEACELSHKASTQVAKVAVLFVGS